MLISELVERLLAIQAEHGDLRVDIKAGYDCGYWAGENVDEVNVEKLIHHVLFGTDIIDREETVVQLVSEELL